MIDLAKSSFVLAKNGRYFDFMLVGSQALDSGCFFFGNQ
jgi:hypothetical protein